MDARRFCHRRDRTLFETITLGVLFQSVDGRITAANPAAERILGLTLEQLQVRDPTGPPWHAVREDGTALPVEEHPSLLALKTGDEVRDVVMGILTPAREGLTWISVSSVPLVREGEDAPCEVLTCFADITDRKRAEDALRGSEERYHRITEGLTDYLYTVDVRDGRAVGTVHSRECEVVTGYTREEFAADTYLWIRMVVPEDRERVIAHVGRILAGEPVAPLEHRIIRKDGRVRWVRDTTITHTDAAGRLDSYDGVVNDITDRKRDEQLDLELERRLLHAQKLQSLGVMAGGIAHDFNNLLTGLMGNLELALMSAGLPDDVRPRIERAHLTAGRAAELAGQMLAYSGRGLLVFSELNLNALVLQSLTRLKGSIPRTVTLNVQLDRHLPPVRADIDQLRQVVQNLLANASEAIGDAPGAVTVATGAVECDREYLDRSATEAKPPPGSFVWLDVSDTGAGMDAETRQRMFDPFFSTKFTGRGLGLSTVLGTVAGHGGAIMVDSAVGRGTTVRVLLPLPARAPAP